MSTTSKLDQRQLARARWHLAGVAEPGAYTRTLVVHDSDFQMVS
jgi:hypothetical protein